MSSSSVYNTDTTGYPLQLRSRFGNVAIKLVWPNVRQVLVRRPRLAHVLRDTSASLVIVAAPAGYGKSTLVRQWLIEAKLPSAWISLDRFDNDPLGYVLLLVEALRTIDENLVASTRYLLWSDDPPAISSLMRTMVADLAAAKEPFILILDDYHVIENQEIHEAMTTLLNASIPMMQLVLVSRVWPPLPLSRFESKDKLARISQEDLRFRDNESYELMRAINELEIARDDADAINLRTEGWVAGLQLVGYMLRGKSPEAIHSFTAEFSGNLRAIESYLWEEVIDLQPSEIRSFLLDIAILDRFCAPLCVAVSGNENSAAIIRHMERNRLFVVGLDEEWYWLRFHHLFSAALMERLITESSQAEINERHRRAAQWFEEHDLVQEASRHAIAGQDWDRAIRLLAPTGLNRSSMDTLERLCSWMQEIPLEALEQHPLLAFRYAWALTWLGRLEQADKMIGIVEHAWPTSVSPELASQLRTLKAFRSFFAHPSLSVELASDAVNQLDPDQVVERGVAYCVLGYGSMYSGDLATAEHAFNQARIGLDGDSGRWFRMTEHAGSAYVFMQQGRLSDAADLLEEALASADENDGLGNQITRRYLSEIRIEQLELGAADRLLHAAQSYNERHRSPIFQPMIEESVAHLAWVRNQTDAAFEAIDRAIQVAKLIPSQMYQSRARAQLARLWIASGQPLFAERWVRSSRLDPMAPLDPELQYEYVTLVRWFLISGNLNDARTLIDALTDHAHQKEQHGNLVELLLLRAVILSKQGETASAIRDLDNSLQLGYRGGFLRTFVIDLTAIQPLLNHPALQKRHGSYLRRIAKAAARLTPQPAKVRRTHDTDLSNREVDVLRLVAEGLSNREIGDRLFISDKTVKRHLSSIYGKLQVTNRVQALERARKMNIL